MSVPINVSHKTVLCKKQSKSLKNQACVKIFAIVFNIRVFRTSASFDPFVDNLEEILCQLLLYKGRWYFFWRIKGQIRQKPFDEVLFCIKYSMHCNENPIYVFPEKELGGLQSQYPNSCVCERLIYSQDRSCSQRPCIFSWPMVISNSVNEFFVAV